MILSPSSRNKSCTKRLPPYHNLVIRHINCCCKLSVYPFHYESHLTHNHVSHRLVGYSVGKVLLFNDPHNFFHYMPLFKSHATIDRSFVPCSIFFAILSCNYFYQLQLLSAFITHTCQQQIESARLKQCR